MNDLIIKWAKDRNILCSNNQFKQLAKVNEEVGELCSAMLKQDKEEIIDAIGDIQITLIILSAQLNVSYDACLESAYNVIKNRTGTNKNGTFIKDE